MRFSAILGLTVAFLCLEIPVYAGNTQEPPTGAKFTPKVNPHPKYFLSFDAYIQPSLGHLFHPMIEIKYQSTNPKCRYNFNKVEGAYSEMMKSLKYFTDQTGHFKKKIPLDGLSKGYCHWVWKTIYIGETTVIQHEQLTNKTPDSNLLFVCVNSNTMASCRVRDSLPPPIWPSVSIAPSKLVYRNYTIHYLAKVG